MHLVRFMSRAEAFKLTGDQTVRNATVHGHRYNSKSIGFCFMPVDGRHSVNTNVYRAARFLSASTTMDFCLYGITKKQFTVSTGRYTDWDKAKDAIDAILLPGVTLKEYCTTAYSLADFEHWTLYKPDPTWPIPELMASPAWIDTQFWLCSCGKECTLKRRMK